MCVISANTFERKEEKLPNHFHFSFFFSFLEAIIMLSIFFPFSFFFTQFLFALKHTVLESFDCNRQKPSSN